MVVFPDPSKAFSFETVIIPATSRNHDNSVDSGMTLVGTVSTQPYYDVGEQSGSGLSLAGRSETVSSTCPPLKRSNYLTISRTHGNIKGTYIIDPTLDIPPSIAPPIHDDDKMDTERDNLNFDAKRGRIDAEIFIPPVDTKEKRVLMSLATGYGSMKARIHRPVGPTVLLTATCSHGHMEIYLPRSFLGPITASRHPHWSVEFSNAVMEQQTTFSDIGNIWKGFIGDPTPFLSIQTQTRPNSTLSSSSSSSGDSGTLMNEDWNGDVVILSSKHGGIWIQYDDEMDVHSRRQSKQCIIC